MELYHVLNRGVDKRSIVMDDRDRKRFVADMLFMNSVNPVNNLNYHFAESMDVGRPYFEDSLPLPDEKLVTIHAWCLMNNHYHFLLSERVEGGISLFLKKFNGGYAKYFNERYERSGALFQGKTKKKQITDHAHYLYIVHYIHFNPLDYKKGSQSWREKKIQNSKESFNWLNTYPWSSFFDYSSKKNLPEILEGSFLFETRDEILKDGQRYLFSLDEVQDKELWLE